MFTSTCRPRFSWFAAILALSLLQGCLSSKHIIEGVQPDFAAINPSRIVAVPLFLLPNPALKVEIDKALIESDKIIAKLEKEILDSFRNQPNVNGVSFQAVRQTLGARSELIVKMEKQLKESSSLLFSTLPSDRARLSKDCVSRKSFLDFYVYCVNPISNWTDLLNQFSRKILNADSALLTVITEYSKNVAGKTNNTSIGIALMVVDTNSGKLIWGKELSSVLNNPSISSSEISVPAPDNIFNEDFWLNFPGRKIPIISTP